jgi:hypothetical protein
LPEARVVNPAMPVLPATHRLMSGAVRRTSNNGNGGWVIGDMSRARPV